MNPKYQHTKDSVHISDTDCSITKKHENRQKLQQVRLDYAVIIVLHIKLMYLFVDAWNVTST